MSDGEIRCRHNFHGSFMTSTPWYITQARDAHAMGHRYIGAKLNAVLAETAPGVVVRCDPLRPEDSMRVAMDMYRRALPGLRTRMNLPAQDHKIAPWTLGYVNDSNNLPINIDLGMDWQSFEDVVLEFLQNGRSNWTPVPIATLKEGCEKRTPAPFFWMRSETCPPTAGRTPLDSCRIMRSNHWAARGAVSTCEYSPQRVGPSRFQLMRGIASTTFYSYHRCA